MKAILLSGEQYTSTNWSGGVTTQLLIEPPRAEYAARDFLWRVSSASVSLPESDFTPLPDYERMISVIEGEMTLSHDGGAPLRLRPGEVHSFSGASKTHSVGRCTDFNLMLRRGRASGSMRALHAGADGACVGVEPGSGQVLIYAADAPCAVSVDGREYRLLRAQSLLLRELNGASADLRVRAASDSGALVIVCRMRRL